MKLSFYAPTGVEGGSSPGRYGRACDTLVCVTYFPSTAHVLARVLPRFAAICTEGLFKCRELKGLREANPLPSTITFLE